MPQPVQHGADDDLLVLDGLAESPLLPDGGKDEEAAAGSDAFVENKAEFVAGRGKGQQRQNRRPASGRRHRRHRRSVAETPAASFVDGVILD